MMGEARRQVYEQFRVGQDKYKYFLLAAAAAGIGIAVQQTSGAVLQWNLLTLLCAVIAWGGSFFCGCKCIEYTLAALYGNHDILLLEDGLHPEQPSNPEGVFVSKEGILETLNTHGAKVMSYGLWQFRLLVCGAVLFLVWHSIEIVLRSFPSLTFSLPVG